MPHILKKILMTTVFGLTVPFASGIPANEEIIGGQLNREAIFHEVIERDLLTHDRRQLSSEELEADATQVIDPLGVEEDRETTIQEQVTIIEKENDLEALPQISWWENFRARIRRLSHRPYEYFCGLGLRVLSSCNLYDWDAAHQRAERFFTEDMRSQDKNRIITALSWNITAEDLDNFEAFVRSFPLDGMDKWYLPEVIEALAIIPIAQRREFEAYTRQFFTEDMRGYEISSIIASISGYIFPQDKQAFTPYINQFIMPGMDGNNIANIIRSIAEYILPNDRKAFKTYSGHFLSDDMSGFSRSIIISSLSTLISPSYRTRFKAYVRSFFTQDMDGNSRAKIIASLASLSQGFFIWRDNIEDFKDFVSRLLTPDMSGTNRAQIIEDVARPNCIPRQDRDKFVNYIRRFLTEDMTARDQAKLISALAKHLSPKEDWHIFEIYASSFFTEDMTAHDRVQIIVSLPNSFYKFYRQQFGEYIQRLISPEMNKDGRVELIKILSHIHHLQADRYIQRLENLGVELPLRALTPRIREILDTPLNRQVRVEGAGMVEIVQQSAGYTDGINVHSNDRDKRTTHAYHLVLEAQKKTTKKEIDSAFKSFMDNLNAQFECERKLKIQYALGLKHNPVSGFGGLLEGHHGIHSCGLDGMSGKELLGRLWHYASHFAFELSGLNEEQRAVEHENAQASLLSALEHSLEEDGHVVCDPGKLQRLAVGVLQGRLEGVDIDGMLPGSNVPLTATETSELVRQAWEEYKQEHRSNNINYDYITGFEIDFNNKHPNADTKALGETLSYIHESEIL